MSRKRGEATRTVLWWTVKERSWHLTLQLATFLALLSFVVALLWNVLMSFTALPTLNIWIKLQVLVAKPALMATLGAVVGLVIGLVIATVEVLTANHSEGDDAEQEDYLQGAQLEPPEEKDWVDLVQFSREAKTKSDKHGDHKSMRKESKGRRRK